MSMEPAYDTILVTKRNELEKSLAAVQTKMRVLLLIGIVLTALVVASLILKVPGYLAFVPLLILGSGAIIVWLWFIGIRKESHQHSRYLHQCNQDFLRLE